MTTHYGYEDGRTLCGAFRGFGAQWVPGTSGPPRVDCAACRARYSVHEAKKKVTA